MTVGDVSIGSTSPDGREASRVLAPASCMRPVEKGTRVSTDAPRPRIEPVVVSDEFTVVGLYHPTRDREQDYQSEAALEDDLIKQLCAQAYEYVDIHDRDGLEANLRVQLEALNNYRFSDQEWKDFYRHSIVDVRSSDGNPVVAKARRIQEDHVQVLTRDDGTTKNISLIDKTNIHRNKVQVIRQYAIDTGARSNRYDVTILVNGLPLVHIELKRRGEELRQAFNQIDRYQRDSFHAGAGDGLFGYVQIFVISNGAHTKYYSNTVRLQHITENQGTRRQVAAANARSFEFTMWWTDAANNQSPDLTDFAATFLAKRTILAILTRYCVLNTRGELLVMRPYQIAATEAILQRIKTSSMNNQTGTVAAGGYVWHTTGSGKTLTSFKTAKLAAGMEGVDKVLFVVDRKDLDHQTIREYNAFAEGTVSANQSTRQLAQQINDPSTPIIVTTIQKLATFVKSHRGHAIYSGHVVLVFDECHRSQFGDMHTDITRAFRNYHLFGFTGTPIFAENASSSGKANLRTTEQAFGDQLHSYTIVDAIRDKTVLPFRVDYLNSFRVRDGIDNHDVEGIDTDSAYMNPQRISAVVSYILEHFNQKTKRHASFQYKERRVNGFNSLFATSSIKAARAYYQEFKRQQADLPEARRLSVGVIYSYAPNAEAPGTGLLSEESMDPSALSQDDRAFLDEAIADYNQQFGASFGTDASGFEGYYTSLSTALAERRIDLVIVVDMFLTGFDSKSLNTLWVDKNLRAHGLIQAFSRTNRILNSVKTFGNIVCFRNLEEATNDAIALFGNKEARGQVLLRPYGEYLSTYLETIEQLRIGFPLPIGSIASEKEQKRFIDLMGQVLRLRNILTSFDDFEGDDTIASRELEDYRSIYLDLYHEARERSKVEKEPIADELVFEMELVKQVDINVDYILMLVEHHRGEGGDGDDREIPVEITRALAASPALRGKRDLIEEFYRRVSLNGDVPTEFESFIAAKRDSELDAIIEAERLGEGARDFAYDSLREGYVPDEGTGLSSILPPARRFGGGGSREAIRSRVLDALRTWVERFSGLGGL